MEKYIKEYTEYLVSHIDNVKKAFNWILEHDKENKINKGDLALLKSNIEKHDLSKWSAEEFEPYALYFYKDKAKYSKDFAKAWEHHWKNNPHHWNYHILFDNSESGVTAVLPMPQENIIEMICDWWAFSFKKGNLYEIFSWYENEKAKQQMHPNTRKEVESILGVLKELLDDSKTK